LRVGSAEEPQRRGERQEWNAHGCTAFETVTSRLVVSIESVASVGLSDRRLPFVKATCVPRVVPGARGVFRAFRSRAARATRATPAPREQFLSPLQKSPTSAASGSGSVPCEHRVPQPACVAQSAPGA
jgi:hypothetical protein